MNKFMLLRRGFPFSKAKSQIQTSTIQTANSIAPAKSQAFAYGHYFPSAWSQDKIRKTLDPSGHNIQTISLVKNQIGENTGKVLFKFKDEQTMQSYIRKYNEDYVMDESEVQRVVILPFCLKTIKQKKQSREGLTFENMVRISNLDFDVTELELRKLAAGFGEISHIEMNARESGINRGFAAVYFHSKKSAKEFVSFANEYVYKDRQLKVQLVEKRPPPEEKKYLETPAFTFKANEELMKRLTLRAHLSSPNLIEQPSSDKKIA